MVSDQQSDGLSISPLPTRSRPIVPYQGTVILSRPIVLRMDPGRGHVMSTDPHSLTALYQMP